MSDSQSPDTTSEHSSKPKFKRDTRVQIALAKFHGINDEPWEIDRIADYLNVKPKTVESYVYDSDLSEQVEEQLAEAQARVRMRIAMKLLDRLDTLEELIDERKDVKKAKVTSHKNVKVEGDVVMNRDGMSVGGDNTRTIEFNVPVPDHFKEVTDVSKEFESLLKEWRLTAQQIEDLLGLEAPDQIESEHREVRVEGRVFRGINTDGFPDPEDELKGTEVSLDDTQ
jgi:predicted Rossmann fold nucleotide-binding protein DprA/Smf involved in DNA uptake